MKRNLPKELRSLRVAIVSHIFATGPALDLEEYLQNKVRLLVFIGHPFSYRKEINSFYRSYLRGKLIGSRLAYPWRLPEPLIYLKDAFYTLLWMLKQKGKIDLYIGSDNFSAFLGLILKKLGKVEEVVLYTIDYMPQRFKNPLLNFLYHFFDKQCLKNCQVIWNVSPVMATAREEYSGLKISDCAPQILVPLGMWYKRIPKLPLSKKNRYQLIFMGHLLEKQGLDVVIKGIPSILKKIPEAKLVVMGTGEYENHLKNLAKRLKIEKHVLFTGYIERHEDIERKLARSALAVAMYKPDPASFTNWSDPGKLKNYLAAGLPIILTSVPPVAKEIKNEKCGVIAEYNEKDFSQQVINLLRNNSKMREYSKNAVKWARQFDWDLVFAKALIQTLV
ncbi:glycosyltransferase [Candidatus Microgenomates bacterium]|nr:glycosyltransferase [Candidatus Microgenomates bacterium]